MTQGEKSEDWRFQDNIRADEHPLAAYRNIGKRDIRRLDGFEKASGRATYTMDVQLPGMLYLRFLKSPHPHAKIQEMDTRLAENYPGVRAVLRYDDPELPEKADLGGHAPSELPVLPEIAHFEGEAVGAAVLADTEAIAEEALRLIDVEWEIRPFVLDPVAALDPGAPLANPEAFPDGNYYNRGMLDEETLGDMEKGFRAADETFEFQSERRLHTWIGPERPCGVFHWNGEYPEVWVKQQRPHICKRVISSWFGGIPMNRIELHCLYQGASFGGWSQAPWNMGGHYCAGLLARRTGRPVKWIFDRREDFHGGEMDEGLYKFKVGAKKDGTITAVKVEAILCNLLFPVFGVAKHFIENTKIPNVHGKIIAVQTNKGPNVPTRCEQNPNCHALTLVFDHVANAFGLDPVEVALKNDGADGHDMIWLNGQKKRLGFQVRDSLRECIEKGKTAIDWDRKWHKPGTRRRQNGRMHGLGFTWTHEWEDSAGSSEMLIRIERDDGTARILGMRCDNGVNAETSYCQIAADELGMRLEDVFYRPHSDNGFFPMTPDSSTNMSVNGFAIRNAARKLKRKILEEAARPSGRTPRGHYPPAFSNVTPEELDIQESVIFIKADPSRRMPISELVQPMGAEGPMCHTPEMGKGAPKSNFSVPLFACGWQVQQGAYSDYRLRFCRQAHFMEVEVDTETGQVIVIKMVNVNDVGKVINWEGCEGQQYGGSYMGAGRGLFEEVVHDPATGVMLNGNLLDYKFATMNDVGHITTRLVETGMGYGPYGLVGIGEDIASVVPALLGPAVYNALDVWIDDFPITPQKVLKALGKL
ncbi:MAG: xanthine dehydrogenase family protein molybdopterin-binding subunit [Deltaproteobacteria bacterium]|nr:xanthine dehydrogenase family protein molybdopterin-binding subunit [Deltaproteobacteria bacterium]